MATPFLPQGGFCFVSFRELSGLGLRGDDHIRLEISGEWVDCARWQGTAGVPDVRWVPISPGAELSVGGLGQFWCPKDAGPDSNRSDWRDVPGDYKLQVEISYEPVPSHLVETVGAPPAGAIGGTLRSNVVKISVKEPTGIDFEALRWARQQKASVISIGVANSFPSSRYAALMIGQRMMMGSAEPDYVKGLTEKGLYPAWDSVPDPSSPDGWRSVSAGADMARWRIEEGERILREQKNFPYERDVRLSVAVSYAVLGEQDKAKRLLRSITTDSGTPEADWAKHYLALQGWQ